MPAPIRIGCFYRSLPMLAAQELGFLDRHGLEVEYEQVSSSIQQFESLDRGDYDIVQTSPDNTANYRLNRDNPIGKQVEGQGFLGLDYGMYLVVAARPGLDSLEKLRGRVVSVDAPDSGFAYVLYEILGRAGLERDEDYEVVLTGGVFDRYMQFMATDEFDATLLSGGFETRAANDGFELLDSVQDIADPYLGVWAAAKQQWLAQNHDRVVSFVRAYRDATDWSFDPANREACIDLLAANIPNTSRELAAQLYELQLRPGVGNVPDGSIDPAGVANVMALRSKFGGFEEDHDPSALASPDSGLYDLSYYEAAR